MKNMNNITKAEKLIEKFFRNVDSFSTKESLFVSAGGGTANVLAGIVSKRTNISFLEAYTCLEEVGIEWAGEFWYQELHYKVGSFEPTQELEFFLNEY